MTTPLDTPLDQLKLSVRVKNALHKVGVRSLGDIAKLRERDILQTPTLGPRSRDEVQALLHESDLDFVPEPGPVKSPDLWLRLHVHGQARQHDDVYVVGDRRGLTALRDAVTSALAGGPGLAVMFTGDGEGFTVRVSRVDDDDLWERLMLPYPLAGDPPPREDAVAPWQLPRGRFRS